MALPPTDSCSNAAALLALPGELTEGSALSTSAAVPCMFFFYHGTSRRPGEPSAPPLRALASYRPSSKASRCKSAET